MWIINYEIFTYEEITHQIKYYNFYDAVVDQTKRIEPTVLLSNVSSAILRNNNIIATTETVDGQKTYEIRFSDRKVTVDILADTTYESAIIVIRPLN